MRNFAVNLPSSKRSKKAAQLRALQRAFATGIMRPLTAAQRMQPRWIDGAPSRKAVAQFIRPNDRLDSMERLEIYNRQYWFRLLDNLHEDFPGLRSLVGEARFHDLSIAYLNRYPSRSFTLRDLGDRLEHFLLREPQWTRTDRTLARDVVRLEWAHIVAFDGAALPPLEVDELLGQDPAKLRLGLQPYLTFLACCYPVDEYLLAIRRRGEPRGEASNAVSERTTGRAAIRAARPQPGKIWLAIHRSQNSVYYKRLEPEAYSILTGLGKGRTLQAACESALRRQKGDKFALVLQGWFSQWASFGWFCRRE